MPASSPDTKYSQAVKLAQDYVTVAEIAERLNCSCEQVYVYLSRARSHGSQIPRWVTGRPGDTRIPISSDDYLVIKNEASKRKTSVHHLLTKIVHHVVQSDLFKAVLDD